MRHVNAGVTCQTCHGPMPEHGARLSVLVAQHGLVRELPRERLQARRRAAALPVIRAAGARTPPATRGHRRRRATTAPSATTRRPHEPSLTEDRRQAPRVPQGAWVRPARPLPRSGAAEHVEKLIPYLVSPDQTVPGVSTYYATTCRECSAACGVIAETRDGRAIKLEGNPEHPVNHGALCARGQAALQGLYNPDRYRGPMVREGRRAASRPRGTRRSRSRRQKHRRGARGNAAGSVRVHQSARERQLPGVPRSVAAARSACRAHLSVRPRGRPRGARSQPRSVRRGVAGARLRRGAKLDRLDRRRLPRRLGRVGRRSSSSSPTRARSSATRRASSTSAPRRSLTGLNADEWIACKPGQRAGDRERACWRSGRQRGHDDRGRRHGERRRRRRRSSVSPTSCAARSRASCLAASATPDAPDVALAVAAINKAAGDVGMTVKPAEADRRLRADRVGAQALAAVAAR